MLCLFTCSGFGCGQHSLANLLLHWIHSDLFHHQKPIGPLLLPPAVRPEEGRDTSHGEPCGLEASPYDWMGQRPRRTSPWRTTTFQIQSTGTRSDTGLLRYQSYCLLLYSSSTRTINECCLYTVCESIQQVQYITQVIFYYVQNNNQTTFLFRGSL